MKELEPGLAADINVTPMIERPPRTTRNLHAGAAETRARQCEHTARPSPSGTPLPQVVLELRADRSYAINGMTIWKEEPKRRLTQI
jgi:hypothetical protein